jgi:hypothetical protein
VFFMTRFLDEQKTKKSVALPLSLAAGSVAVVTRPAQAQATVSADIEQMSTDVTAIGGMIDNIRPIAIGVVLIALALMLLKRLGYA